jgi:hypothetical protein
MNNDPCVVKGVTSSWDYYLRENPITIEYAISGAISSAFEEWLDRHKTEVIAAIADKASSVKVQAGEVEIG